VLPLINNEKETGGLQRWSGHNIEIKTLDLPDCLTEFLCHMEIKIEI